ncbi:hypothetical protein NL676_015748 [Syzygium grande]|nr:hypothetical protein NL676_015748 [Syzygium grande]
MIRTEIAVGFDFQFSSFIIFFLCTSSLRTLPFPTRRHGHVIAPRENCEFSRARGGGGIAGGKKPRAEKKLSKETLQGASPEQTRRRRREKAARGERG